MRSPLLRVAPVLALVVGGVLIESGDAPRANAASAPRTDQVLVVNPATDPVNVQGQATVSGTVTCMQNAPYQVSGSVDIGSPTVSVAPKRTETALLRAFTVGADNVASFIIPTSEYEEIRVVLLSNCAICTLRMRYFLEGMLIDEDEVVAARIVSRLLRVPGTELLIQVENPGGPTSADARIAVYGRP